LVILLNYLLIYQIDFKRNYPWYTSVNPAVTAIAAGNCVVVKPSEMCPRSSNLIKEVFEKYLDKDCYAVIEG
jgi:aldehyde dehydrogenase (NAD+)